MTSLSPIYGPSPMPSGIKSPSMPKMGVSKILYMELIDVPKGNLHHN